MSFLYDDKNFLQQVIKLSQDQAQDNQYRDLALKLVRNLQTQLSGGTVFTAERADANLDQIDLVDLDSLLNFLQFNGIKANAYTLVYKAQNLDLNSFGENAKLYFPYPNENPVYYVYKKGLFDYLNDLKSKSANNPLFSASVSKLLQKVNTELPDVMKTEPPRGVAGPEDNTGSVTPQKERSQTGLTTQDLRKFLGRFPLLEDRIDFQRIRNFSQAYTQITGQTPEAINNINNELNKIATNFRVGPSQGFPTSSDEVARVLPQGVHPYAYFSSLYSLIVNVKQLLNYLKSANYDMMDDQLKQQIDQQVGTGTNDGGAIVVQNLEDIQDAMKEAQNWRRTK